MKTALLLVTASTLAACSSSGGADAGPGPCQTSQTALDYGTCADLADAGGGPVLSQLTITAAQRAACESACTSSTDLAAVTAAFGCLNAIPADAGACAAETEEVWGTKIAAQAIGCETALQTSASKACVTAVTGTADAG